MGLRRALWSLKNAWSLPKSSQWLPPTYPTTSPSFLFHCLSLPTAAGLHCTVSSGSLSLQLSQLPETLENQL